MRFKYLGLIAAVALIAACETAPEESAATSGAGDTAAPATAAAPSASAEAAPLKAMGPAPGSQEDLEANVGDRVFFDFDKSSLKPEAQTVLQRQAAWLKSNPSVRVTIEGHCDERGTREYNLALGERRANAVKDYLTALGIDRSRVKTISYGKERPVAMGSNAAAWAQNRRGVTKVIGAGS
ncbi:MAG: peptidoglycan-associated lipoprotein Pal [Proteobacteria bacterium]|nr:peptidoglycan-associated lipoprotein Pal [Pseudomonadota bacterium]